MKKLFSIVLCCCITSIFTMNAQNVVMTFTAGVSPQQNPEPHHIFVNRSSPREEFTFDLAQVKASYFVGVGARYNVNQFFFAGEAQYNRREYLYNISHTFPGFGRTEQTEILSESMNVINLPLTLGVDLGIIDVTSGFLPQVIVSQDSDLKSIDGYSQKLDKIRFGWHSGLAANIKDLRVGLSYQMDFNNYADHAYIHDQNLSLQGRSSRILGTLTYQF
ncbi:MAG TPA: hypothetical protein VMZ69_10685 [Saprospiraceae bacterium]|nr:hypothetical protein [Saprospiraceae bacterium]